MGSKRPAEDTEKSASRPRRETAKRARLSPPKEDNSSDPSSCSVSVDSALQSSPPLSEHTRQSSLSSSRPSNEEDASEESISSDDVSGADSDDVIITIGGAKKPDISSSHFRDGAEDLRTRLDALLPRMAESNGILKAGEEIYNMEDVEESEQYIEMDLGLGVLEERCASETNSSSDDDSDFDEPEGQGDGPASPATMKASMTRTPPDAMSTLLGRRTAERTVGIEDLG